MFKNQQQLGNTEVGSSENSAPPASSNTKHLTIPGIKPVLFSETVTSLPIDTPVAPALSNLPIPSPVVVRMPTVASTNVVLDRDTPTLPYKLHLNLRLILNQHGKAFAIIRNIVGNVYVLAVGSKKFNAFLLEKVRNEGASLNKRALGELNEVLEAYAEQYGVVTNVYLRVAPIEDGIEIDLGDEAHTRISITAGQVHIVTSGSKVPFYRTVNSKPMVMPAAFGNLKPLRKYLNTSSTDALLLTAWISYTLAHSKMPTSNFPILVLQGNQGSGKTSLCENVIIRIIDPSAIGVQVFPGNAKDLAIAGQNSHVLCFDNLRSFKAYMADALCIAATGGIITGRQLYTDSDQQATRLHVALVLNGIHQFIDQPDLAQRCLTIHLTPIEEAKRKSEVELAKEFDADLPEIMRGLFELIAGIFTHLPNVEITNPERMIDFVKWLAAMEMVDGAPAGTYQGLYSDSLNQGQLDTLMDNPLAAAIIEFTDELKGEVWSDTPSELLVELNSLVGRGTQFSRDWPQNPIALSKRIAGLQAGLLSQGVKIELTRGKQRTVTIRKMGA